MKQLFSNELLSARAKIARHSTMSNQQCSTMTMSGLSRDYTWCFIYHELPFAINMNLVCAYAPSRQMRHPDGYSSVLLTFHYAEMFWPCVSTDTCTKHGFTPTLLPAMVDVLPVI
jgi:hypothetical protein